MARAPDEGEGQSKSYCPEHRQVKILSARSGPSLAPSFLGDASNDTTVRVARSPQVGTLSVWMGQRSVRVPAPVHDAPPPAHQATGREGESCIRNQDLGISGWRFTISLPLKGTQSNYV